MTPLVVFDLDGVLCDTRHRQRFLQRRPKDWDGFFLAVPDDPPLSTGVALAVEAAREGEVAYLTGRPERCREDTQRWLARHGLPTGRLSMRPAGDTRPARLVKPALLRRLAGDQVVALVVDDDPSACAAYRSAGYPVLQADWATAPPALRRAQQVEGRT